MPTVSRDIPENPHLDVPKREARALLKLWRAVDPEALERIKARHPKFKKSQPAATTKNKFLLSDAQLVIAREYGFSNWTQLKQRFESNIVVRNLLEAIHEDDRENVIQLLRAHPHLLHIPLWSGNWGPPMSHAANLGRLQIVEAIHTLGARDHQHAFDRAILQGKLETARWLHQHGAKVSPGLVMGPCETLNPSGLAFLAELNAPFTNEKGDRLAPLALVLETYGRNRAGKHAVLKIFSQQGYTFPDTPIMAFHRGDIPRLKKFLRTSPKLIHQRFTSLEIYPPELGCSKDGRSGMHWTPINGTTLLHLAIDFDEPEIFDLLLATGADVNAPALLDGEGLGGHTPIFNAVVSHGRNQGNMAHQLLERGADTRIRVSLKKFLDWRETPKWHTARNVTPLEWGQTFPEKSWINQEALGLLASRGTP